MIENPPGLNLNNLKTASSPSERVVTSRSTSVRQQARQRQPSFSSFFSEGGQDNRARSMSVEKSNYRRNFNLGQNLRVPIVPADVKVGTSIKVMK